MHENFQVTALGSPINHTSNWRTGAFISTTQPGAALATEATSEGHRPGREGPGKIAPKKLFGEET